MGQRTSLKILVTGGSGFLGKKICQQLLQRGDEPFALSRVPSQFLKRQGIKFVACDLTRKDQVEEVFKNYHFDAVIHTAAKAGIWGPYHEYEKINVQGTKNLIQFARQHCVRIFIHTSTPSVVYGDTDIIDGDEALDYPAHHLTSYAKTKAIAERYVLSKHASHHFQVAALRPHLIWGVDDPHLLPRLVTRAKRGKLVQVGDGNNMVDIIHVDNAAGAHIQLMDKMLEDSSFGGEAYFIGQERPVKLWEFMLKILENKGIASKPKKMSLGLAFKMGTVFEFIYSYFYPHKEPPMTKFLALQLGTHHYFKHDKAIADFNFHLTKTIEEGLEEFKRKA